MTERQRTALDFIEAYIAENRYSPSYREIADHMGLASAGNVHRLVHALRKRGFIRFNDGLARGIELVE